MGLPERNNGRSITKWTETAEVRNRVAAAVNNIMDPDQFIAHALVAFRDPKVMKCTPQSQLRAFYDLAALALLPTLDQAALIPYGQEIKVMPQWQGYKAVMERNPAILEIQGELVHRTDQFHYENGQVLHRYDPFNPNRSINGPDDIRGGYLKIIYADGRPPKYHFVPVAHIEKCRKCAQTDNTWSAWYKQQALKTLFRDGYARRVVPIDPLVAARLEKIIKADDIILGNDPLRPAGGSIADREPIELPPGDPPDPPEAPEQGLRGPENAPDATVVDIDHMEQLYAFVMDCTGCDKPTAVESVPDSLMADQYGVLLNMLADYKANEKQMSLTTFRQKVINIQHLSHL